MLETLFNFVSAPLVLPIAAALVGYVAGQYWPWSTTGKAAVESRVSALEAKVEGLFSKAATPAVPATPAVVVVPAAAPAPATPAAAATPATPAA